MTNFEKAEPLLEEAKWILKEARRAFKQQAWNLTMRRAQEVVELVLKATLLAMSVDYPKAHDVGEALGRVLKAKEIPVREKTIRELKEISRKLAAERAPAFYYESEYSQEEAQQAVKWAEKVMRFGTHMKKRLKGE